MQVICESLQYQILFNLGGGGVWVVGTYSIFIHIVTKFDFVNISSIQSYFSNWGGHVFRVVIFGTNGISNLLRS